MNKLFKAMFSNKGNMAPIANKSQRNFEFKLQNSMNASRRVHYFSVGHIFRHIDAKVVFGSELDEREQALKPTKYLSLQLESFDFVKDLKTLIDNIRNINSHYVHDFNKLTVNSINKKLICFLKEAIELSVVFSYLKANELSYEEYQQDFDSGKKLVEFLCNRFYPNKEHQMIQRSTFLSMSKMDAIEHILFINVDLDFEWKLSEEYPVFMISKGKYLSFNSCLFLLSMFLYKGEAEKMISKIKGFKKNDDDEHRSKRNIFTFFSKKFSSQDVDSEEQHLVKFRD